MKVLELHSHLTNYLAKSSINAEAEVMIQLPDQICYTITGANDAIGFGQHLLILLPDYNGIKIGVKEMGMQ